MGLQRLLMQVTWFSVLFMGMAAAPLPAQLARPNCTYRCGHIQIPFPFGLTKNCSLNSDFLLHCNQYSGQLRTGDGNLTVNNISVQGQLEVSMYIAHKCVQNGFPVGNASSLEVSSFTINYTQNLFVAVGCDTIGYLYGYSRNLTSRMGCLSMCTFSTRFYNGDCSGIGCCHVEILPGLKDFTLTTYTLRNYSEVTDDPCSYAFFVKKDWTGYPGVLRSPDKVETLPVVLDWAIGNQTCNRSDPICGQNSECYSPDNRRNGDGYSCRCKDGYDGNPYLLHGCQDFDECHHDPYLCNVDATCKNTEGSFTCSCNPGYVGDGKNGSVCTPVNRSRGLDPATRIALAIGVGFAALFVSGSWLYLVLKQKKFIQRKEKFFEQNGGLILKERLREQVGSTDGIKIFTLEELEKATKNFSERSIIGRGGFGIVYKGILPGNRVIAIKRSKTVAQSQIDQFINEIVVLSRINHKNVVKLLGCCLETKVPLLVYEFIPRGSLFKHIRYEGDASPLQWQIRLRIAIDSAEAISYLHSATIIHRDIKSANILLDNDFIAKVSDFGTSKLVPRDQKEVVTLMQGTFGYLDPEYLQTNQLTEKSDVYSFGVVLVELLTGEEVFSSNRLDDEINLAIYFLSSLKEGRLFDVLEKCIVEDGNKEQIKEVVELTKRCLKLRGDERPTMKEVAMDLKIIGNLEKHPRANPQSNPSKATPLPAETSDAYKDDGVGSETFGFDSMTNQATLGLKDGR